MANEIEIVDPSLTGSTLYAHLTRAGQTLTVAGPTFGDTVNAGWVGYAVTLTERDTGGGGTGHFVGSIPAGTPAGDLGVVVYRRAGGAPAFGDEVIGSAVLGYWDGTALIHQTGDAYARLGTPANASVAADVAALLAALPRQVRRNTALANFAFPMVDESDHVTPLAGLTVTAQRSIDGGAFAACANAPTAIGGGVYKIDLAASDLNGVVVVLLLTADGADPRLLTVVTQP